ncbi:uncharacterized protein BDZ99DRAFT_512743 [Mytilinidion resinicola]|uniref:DNA mismatch repair protein S5 domain-containing protein n=1 Tax=Mytilinidion resinicola TaxID=574789 RepID=A0A6A6XZP2_9PEZI|nr:uncharacterized protein BDZ99DRAFT_512743 [Mytilinidion resinicola]KAF2801869.1 hypothetical protein BDZ99DRAFT_512743 [Mytilinidion resinicola]
MRAMEDTAPPVKGSIAALPPTTIKLIGSTQVLSDPSSVVKELIDNALDARASSIVVEISSNTLDVIQVRDNGHGIAPEDRPMAARRYSTSKIREFDDLKDVGGRWLGFRGEALASIAEMSGSLSIITRVEGEAVAVLLKIARNGEIDGQDRASHPMGTTVRVTDFFKSLPVRKQAALKHSSKYLAKVKKLMQGYALCRPKTRFSLRVLKAANEKINWMYAPKPDANLEDAAFKVIGRECASQCEWTIMESDGFEIQAFLPKPTAEASKVRNVGHFISVDSRPVSALRGVLKQLVVLFKEKIAKSSVGLTGVRDPFIFMNIVCPPDSYDANIEPAKDDVLFENSDMVVSARIHNLRG